MGYGIRLQFEAQRSIAFGGIGANYALIGSVFTHPIRFLLIDNLTDADLQFSLDNNNDHFVLAAMSGKVFDVTANKVRDDGFFIPEGGVVAVKQIGVPASGNVYVSVAYAAGD